MVDAGCRHGDLKLSGGERAGGRAGDVEHAAVEGGVEQRARRHGGDVLAGDPVDGGGVAKRGGEGVPLADAREVVAGEVGGEGGGADAGQGDARVEEAPLSVNVRLAERALCDTLAIKVIVDSVAADSDYMLYPNEFCDFCELIIHNSHLRRRQTLRQA